MLDLQWEIAETYYLRLYIEFNLGVHVLKFVTAVDVNGHNEIDSGGNVVNLNDSNFETTVLNSGDKWLVEFFSPYCRKCKKFKPQWNQAAAKLKDKIKVSKNFSFLLYFLLRLSVGFDYHLSYFFLW